MKCVTLCLVFLFAVATYGYPQRVTLVGIPNSRFYRPYSPVHSERALEETADESTDEGVFAPVDPRIGYDQSDSDSSYYSVSFADMMRSMQEALFRMRHEMNDILRRLPEESAQDGKGLDVFPLGSDFDLSDAKNKSTSETKVIDGQLVTVNETVVRSGGEHSGAVFRVKTIQVRPTESNPTDVDVENESSSPFPANVESEVVESKNEDSNDIPNNEGKMQFSEWDPVESSPSDHINEVETINDVEMVEENNYKPEHYDLSRDTLVNDYLSDQHESQGLVMINPDAEFIDVNKVNPKQNEYYRYESQPIQPNEDKLERL